MTQRDDPGFEPSVADWLQDDPSVAPRAVLDTVLAAIPSIPQRRRGLARLGGRTQPMPAVAKLAIGMAAVIAVVVAGSLILNGRSGPPVGNPSPSVPTPTPTSAGPNPTPSTSTYRSTRYGFAFDHPAGWIADPAKLDWPIDTAYTFGAQWVDAVIAPEGGVPRAHAARQPLKPAQTGEDWVATYVADAVERVGTACGDISLDRFEPIQVGGEPGLGLETTCSEGATDTFVVEALLVHGGAAYVIGWASSAGNEAADREAFQGILDSFRPGEDEAPAIVVESARFAVPLRLAMPGDWQLVEDAPDLVRVHQLIPPGAAHAGTVRVGLDIAIVDDVYAEPCATDPVVREPAVGPTVDAFMTWLAAVPDVNLQAVAPVEIGGYPGLAARDAAILPPGCDALHLWPSAEEPVFIEIYQRHRFHAVDVEGQRVVVLATVSLATQGDVGFAEVDAVLETLTFE